MPSKYLTETLDFIWKHSWTEQEEGEALGTIGAHTITISSIKSLQPGRFVSDEVRTSSKSVTKKIKPSLLVTTAWRLVR